MGEVEERLPEAGGAVDVDAVGVDFAFGFFGERAAAGAVGGHCKFFFWARRMLGVDDDFGDVGDDVAGALDFDPASGADAEAGDFVGIEEADVGDGDASDDDGNEYGERSELAGAADGDLDFADLGDGGAGGEFVGDGPARVASGIAEAELGGLGVDFDDYAVDFVAKRFAGCFDIG